MSIEQELRIAWERMRATPFPLDSAVSDELSDLRADLALYDGHVAGIATSALDWGTVDRKTLQLDAALRKRLEALRQEDNEVLQSEVRIYLEYLTLLDSVLLLAGRLVQERRL